MARLVMTYWLMGILLAGGAFVALIWAAARQKPVVVRVLSKWTRMEPRTSRGYGYSGYIGTDKGYAWLADYHWYEECAIGKSYVVKVIKIPGFLGRYRASRIPAEAKIAEVPPSQWLSIQALVGECQECQSNMSNAM